MRKYRQYINNNLQNGDCGLWFNVITTDGRNHVCPYNECKTFNEAIIYYLKNYTTKFKQILCIEHHKISKSTLNSLAQAC